MRVHGSWVVGVCVLVLAGCSVDKAEPVGLTASPTASPTPPPTPSPTSTSTEVTATDLSDPDLGIVFVDTPDLTGPAASAHDAVAIFQLESWRSVSTGAVSPALVQFVSPVLLRKVESLTQRNADGGWGFDGVMRITISDVVLNDATATASVCRDYSEVLFTNTDGSPPRSYAEIEFPQFERSSMRLSTFDDGVTWRPEDGSFEGHSC